MQPPPPLHGSAPGLLPGAGLGAGEQRAAVALYHLSVKPVSRGGGRSAVATAAYRSAEELHDARQGVTHDYRRKQGVDARLLLMADDAGALLAMEGAGWTAERERLWNAAEAAEKRKDARVAREYEVALPCELDREGRRELVRAFAGELVERYGVAVDAAIHAPGREGDQRNWHAHVLATTRQAVPGGMGEKAAIELSDAARGKLGLGKAADEIEGMRALWGEHVNQALEQARVAERVDHRSYERQGREELTPQQHAGPAVSGMERKAEAKRRRARVREQAPEAIATIAGPEATQAASVTASAPAPVPAALELGGGSGRPGKASSSDESKLQEFNKAGAGPMEACGPAPERQAAQHGPGRAREGATGQDAVWPVSSKGPGLDRPVRGAAGMYGSGAEPVTRVGQRNAEIQAHNRAVAAARAAVEQTQRVLARLERAVRRMVELARGLGAQAAVERETREREAVRQREALERAEAAKQAEVERAAAELRQHGAEQARPRQRQGPSLGM